MKYILILTIFTTGLFAHGISSEHLHMLNNFHLVDFVLLAVGFVSLFFISKKLLKGNN